MKKGLLALLLIINFLGIAGIAGATQYTFQPNDPGQPDLWDLSHGGYYTWGIDWKPLAGETIVGVSMFFDDIRNWRLETNDLYLHLLESPEIGARKFRDRTAGNYDQFTNQGILLNHWEDLPNTAQDITYNFDTPEIAALLGYSTDGNFGFGFDPDCHFYNNGITLTIETNTEPVPEPATMFLFGTGLIGFAGLSRKLKK